MDAGWRAAAILSGMFMFVVLGQLMTLDMSLTFWMTASLAGFLLAQREDSQQAQHAQRGWMLVAWVAAAFGVLTKGLVAAAIPAAVLVHLQPVVARFCPLAQAACGAGVAFVSSDYRALALAGGAASRRFPAVFFRA